MGFHAQDPARRAAATLEQVLGFHVRDGGTSHTFWAGVPNARALAVPHVAGWHGSSHYPNNS